MANPVYRFGDFALDAAARELRRKGEAIVLPSSAFDCLVYLVEHRDRAVGRDELMAAVWGRADVTDMLLGQTVVRVRRALDDDGGRQQSIRTVPRFGYRWVAETTAGVAAPINGAAAATAEEPRFTQAAGASVDAIQAAPRTRDRRPYLRTVVVGLVALVAAIAFVVFHFWNSNARPPPAHASAVAPSVTVQPAMVLPAVVDAPPEWEWLRLGLMDLVARRLRSGNLATVPSESVVRLLKRYDNTDGETLLREPGLASIASLRILPRIAFANRRWTVRLDALGMQRSVSVQSEADDAIGAGREAADRLLRKLGHTPIAAARDSEISPAIEMLLQKSGAAMLADQLDAARNLIEHAEPALQQQPRVQWRLAQIELRGGDYATVETRLAALLDRVPAKPDPALRARILLTLAAAEVRQNRIDEASAAYEEAIALRKDSDDAEALGIAHLGRGIVLGQKAKFDQAIAEVGRARSELETTGDALGVAQVDVNLGDLENLRYHPAAAFSRLNKAAVELDRLGAREGLAYVAASAAEIERQLLDPNAALVTIERCWPPEAHTGNLRIRWNLTLVRADVLADLGRLGEAGNLVARIRTEADPALDAATRAQADALAARLADLGGDPVAAAELARAALSPTLRDNDMRRYARTWLLRVRALRAGTDATLADEEARRLHAWITTEPDAWRLTYAKLIEAQRSWSTGQRDAAFGQFAEALARATALNIPEDQVAVAQPYILALIEAGHLDEAKAVAGGIAPWAEDDLGAAIAQARLFQALNQTDAWHKATSSARRLAGEGKLPDGLSAAGD